MTAWRNIAARLCGAIAALFLAAMMMLTVADVALRSTINTPIRGVYDLIELLLAGTFFFALPAVFLRDDNIMVNVIDDLAPRSVAVLKRIAEVLAALILALMAWQGWIAARDAIAFNDVTADLGLPRALHWTALLIGVIGAGIAALAMGLRRNGQR